MNRWLPIGLLVGLVALVAAGGCAAATSSSSRPSAAPQMLPGGAPAAGEEGVVEGGGRATADRMIIYTATLGLRFESVAGGVDRVSALALRYGGYVAASTRSESGATPTATVTIKVPARDFGAAMAELRRIAERVVSENITSQDVTDEYADLGAQLRSYQATEAQLLELMRRANSVDDVLKVQQQLTQVRVQIERIQGRILGLERRSELATITVTISERPPLAGVPREEWDPGRVAAESWNASLRFLQVMASAAIRVTVFLWWLLVPGVLVAIAIVVLVGRRPQVPPRSV